MTADALPPMLTRRQAREFLNCSDKTLSRMMQAGNVRYVKLGNGRSAPVRFSRDHLMSDLGLESKRGQRRRCNAAEREYHNAMAAIGGAK